MGQREGGPARVARRLAAWVTAALVVGLVAVPAGPAAANDVVVRIGPTGVDPATVMVTVGSTVTWVNQAGAERSIAADDGSFESGKLANEQTYQFVFTVARTVSYHVAGQPGQVGEVVVIVAGADNPATAPATPATPFAGPVAERPTDLASTGDADGIQGVLGAALVLTGVALVYAVRRRPALAWLGSAFARHDDLLPRPSLRQARGLAERVDPRWSRRRPRRSRHRV